MAIFSGYGPHFLYSLALLSASMHLVYQRRAIDDERRRIDGHVNVLQSLVDRMRAGELVPSEEVERLKRLGRSADGSVGAERKLTWKEALLGKKD